MITKILPIPEPRVQPSASDVFRSEDSSGKARSPDPLIEVKHADNPAIVTIFGAGIAGLTAAHELATRGCLVQVVDPTRDAYERSRPHVGGMAATQYARIRANIEDAHPELLDGPWRDPQIMSSSSTESVRQWLIRLFAHNRSWWIHTEAVTQIPGVLYNPPEALTHPPDSNTIGDSLLDALKTARYDYRQSWLWDLVVRSAEIKLATTKEGGDVTDTARLVYAGLTAGDNRGDTTGQGRAETKNPVQLAQEILKFLVSPKGSKLARPVGPDLTLSDAQELIELAFEREFLAFRLNPYALEGFPGSERRARDLLKAWIDFFCKGGLEPNLLVNNYRTGENLGGTGNPNLPSQDAAVQLVRQPGWEPEFPIAWIEVEIIEERLPGEHGFRFFPSYYRHIDDTMKRIPLCPGGCSDRTAYDNLRPTVHQVIGLSEDDRKDALGDAYAELPPERRPPLTPKEDLAVETARQRPTSIEGWRDATYRFWERLGCKSKDAIYFSARLLRFMTSCTARREQYQEISWGAFTGLTPCKLSTKPPLDLIEFDYTPAMKNQIESAAQCVLALSAGEADARTYGNATVQLFLDLQGNGSETDRTLNGPTSDAWLDPWRDHLEQLGVRFFLGKLKGITKIDDELVPEIDLYRDRCRDGHPLLRHEEAFPGRKPDFYVLALDLPHAANAVQEACSVLNPVVAPDFHKAVTFFDEVIRTDPAAGKPAKTSGLKNMTGVQFFFNSKTAIGNGHTYYPYSDWGLSSISQSEFWSERGSFADGYLGVLSVDVSNTDGGEKTFGDILGDPSTDTLLGRLRVAKKVWDQMKDRTGGVPIPFPRAFHTDQNVGVSNGALTNTTPFLAALPGTWRGRPGIYKAGDERTRDKYAKPGDIAYAVNAERWVLCGTYMATNTRMTSMEAANESGRHAATAILKRLERSDAKPGYEPTVDNQQILIKTSENETYNYASEHRIFDYPDIWKMEENEMADLKIFRDIDEELFKIGLPHWMDICDFDRRLDLVAKSAELDRAAGLKHFDGAKDILKNVVAGIDKILGIQLVSNPYRDAAAKISDLVKTFFDFGS